MADDAAPGAQHAGDTEQAQVPAAGSGGPAADDALLAEDLLVEEVSIDGMCGVY